MPRRQENVLAKLEEELWEAVENVKEPMERTITTWLRNHALTNPKQWAEQSLQPGSPYADWEEYYEESGSSAETRVRDIVDTYMRLKNNNRPWHSGYQQPNFDVVFSKMMRENDGYSFESIQKLGNILLPEQREMLVEELSYEGLEDFNERFQTQFATEDEVIVFINNASAEDLGIDISDFLDNGLEHWVPIAEANGLLDDIVFEINHKIVFPVWYQYWSAQGIVETRANVEKVADELKSAKTIDETIAAVSLALNVAHQSGDMLDHLENYGDLEDPNEAYGIRDLLKELSEGKDVEKWNEELRAIGVQI